MLRPAQQGPARLAWAICGLGITVGVPGCEAGQRPPPGLGDWGALIDSQVTENPSPPGTSTGGIGGSTGLLTAGSESSATTAGTSDESGPGSSTGGPASATGDAGESSSSSGTRVASGTDPGSGTVTGPGEATDDSSSTTGSPQGEFPPPRPFGDDQAELDLVGTWGVPRYGDLQSWEARLDIDVDGTFSWREHDPQCELVTDGRGVVWVENNQLVLHYDSYDGEPVWPTVAATGLTVQAPFRIRLAYAPAGTTLALAAPEGFTVSAPWAGIALLRQTVSAGPVGVWMHESQLEALVPGEPDSQVILVDRYQAELRPDGTGLRSMTRTFQWPSDFSEPTVYVDSPWVDGTPGNAAGAVTIGSRAFAYDTVRLHTFGQWDALRANPQTRCQ